ncbi:MAG: hypothetical protein IPL46_15855 [Saprospiraceae bacterium]|nr:hypothetical protein [Saprospiraceae bacterium]
MRKNLVLAALLLITCSFVKGPDGRLADPASTSGLGKIYYGGAYLMFAGKFGGEITRKEITQHQSLTVDGCAAGSRIFKFTLDITTKGKTNSLQAESNNLTEDMLSHLNELRPGDEFEFIKTKAYLPNGKDVVDVMGKRFVVV